MKRKRNTPLFLPELLAIVAGFVRPADRLSFLLTSHEFLGVGAAVFTPGPGVLLKACYANNVFLATRLLEGYLKYVDTTTCGEYALRWASTTGHDRVVALLLADPRVDPTTSASSALRLAVEDGHDHVVALFLKDGRADPAACDSESLSWASRNDYPSVVALLLEDGRVNPTAENNIALRSATFNGHAAVIALLTAAIAKK